MSDSDFSLRQFLATAVEVGPCLTCGGEFVCEDMKERIPVGEDEWVEARVPMRRCSACGAVITDEGAEEIREAAVRLRLGLLTAKEVKAVRDNLGFSRREFAAAYGIPTATMERWENGRAVQSSSYDTLLRALSNRGTASALDRRRIAFRHEQNGLGMRKMMLREISKDLNVLADAEARAQKFNVRGG